MNYIVLFILLILVFAFLRVNNFISEDYNPTTTLPSCSSMTTASNNNDNNNIDLTIQYYNNNIVFYWYTNKQYEYFKLYENSDVLKFDEEENILADKIGFYEKPYVQKGKQDTAIENKYYIRAYKNGCYDESKHLESYQHIPQLKNVELEDYAVCRPDASHKIMFADIDEITKNQEKYKKIENAGADEIKYYTSDLYKVDFSNNITDNELNKLNDPNVNRFKINFK